MVEIESSEASLVGANEAQDEADEECRCGLRPASAKGARALRMAALGNLGCFFCCSVHRRRLPEVIALAVILWMAVLQWNAGAWFGLGGGVLAIGVRCYLSGSVFALMLCLYFPATLSLTLISKLTGSVYYQPGRFRVAAILMAGIITILLGAPAFLLWSSTLGLGAAITAEFGPSDPPNPMSDPLSFYDWMFRGTEINGPYGSPGGDFSMETYVYVAGIEPKPDWQESCTRPFAGQLELDVYFPASRNDGQPVPIIFNIHGGGFIEGDKSTIQAGAYFLERGYAIVSPNYDFVCDGFNGYEMVAELTLALDYVRANATKWGFDPNRIFVAGGSAGGYLALMLSYTLNSTCGNWQTCGITGVFNLFGATTDRSHPAKLNQQLAGSEDPEVIKNAFPAYNVNDGLPATLTLHGTYDSIVPYSHGVALHDALQEAGVKNLLIPAPTYEHVLQLGFYGAAAQVHRFALERFIASTAL